MKTLKFLVPLVAFSAVATAHAQPSPDLLNAKRQQVIHRYVEDLAKADANDIGSLFTDDGIVMSTSRGKNNAKSFFSDFLPMIYTAATDLHQSFISLDDVDRYSARFHLSFQLKDGEKADGEYIDEFVFEKNSAKLKRVDMFENLHYS